MWRNSFVGISLAFVLFTPHFTWPLIQAEETSTHYVSENQTDISQYKTPQDILTTLASGPNQMESSLNYLSTQDDQVYTSQTLSYLKDGDYYYFSNTQAPLGRYLVETKQHVFQASYFLAEDLAIEAASRLNQSPEKYKKTEAEKYYLYAQEHGKDIRGLYLTQSQYQDQHEKSLQLAQKQDHYMITILLDFITTEEIDMKESRDANNGAVLTYTIGKKQTQKLAELAKKFEKDDQDLKQLSQSLQSEYVGTLSFSMMTGDVTLSIGALSGRHVLEYRIGISNNFIKPPQENRIQTVGDFNKETKTNFAK